MTHPHDQIEIDCHPTDPDLERTLHELFDKYGVLGVITAASRYGLRVATPKTQTCGECARHTPQIGDMIRVDDDHDFGIKGAISRVNGLIGTDVVIAVDTGCYQLVADDVTVVTYDNTTRTWVEVGA